jgi:hypothetical protein
MPQKKEKATRLKHKVCTIVVTNESAQKYDTLHIDNEAARINNGQTAENKTRSKLKLASNDFSGKKFTMRLPTEKFVTAAPNDIPNGGDNSHITSSTSVEQAPEKQKETHVQKLFTFAKQVAIHGGLAVAVAVYIICGALIFQRLERGSLEMDNATKVKELLDQIRSHLPDNVTDEMEVGYRSNIERCKYCRNDCERF